VSPASIAKEYKLADRSSVYRHAHALGLFPKRQRNIRAALERIIEHAGEVEVTAASVVAAVQAYTKINGEGQWIDRSETLDLNALFDRMTVEELDAYARDGALPRWYTDALAGKTESDDESKTDIPYMRVFATMRASQENQKQ
jgi:hypothetical protein